MLRIVRLKGLSTLEDALSTVLEEVNFAEQYNLCSKMLSNKNPTPQTSSTNNSIPTQQCFIKPPMQHQFKFVIPHNNDPNIQNQQHGFRPNLQLKTPQQPFGYKPPQFQRPPFQPTGFRPQPGQFVCKPQTNFGYRFQPKQV